MKAVAVYPGRKNSVHLEEIPRPSVGDAPQGRGVLVRVLKVGVDATDKEINEALYGNAPGAITWCSGMSRSASSRRWARTCAA